MEIGILTTTNKKVEIRQIDDVLELSNSNFSDRTNHYLKCLLLDLRLIFRNNRDNLDELIEFYEYIEYVLSTDFPVNRTGEITDKINTIFIKIGTTPISCETIMIESLSKAISSLYTDYHDMLLKDKIMQTNNNVLKIVLENQLINQVNEFDILTLILESTSDEQLSTRIREILTSNYKKEYTTYLSFHDLEK